MRLFEMGSMPEQAGVATLVFGQGRHQQTPPFRRNEKIVLPDHPDVEFFSILGGEQFLLRENSRDRLWFGGTDEQPFLVQLEPEVFSAFRSGGEERFFEGLKPQLAGRIESYFKVESVRQGDIFATPVPVSWEDLTRARWVIERKKVGPSDVKSRRIFETRHSLEGQYLRCPVLGFDQQHLFEGVITAPDHEPRILEGVHVMTQARNLFDPRNAD